MKLEYLSHVNLYHPEDELIRLYDFDSQQAKRFQDIIEDRILQGQHEVELTTLDFIKPVNCKLKLILGNNDRGIQRINEEEFYCQLTENSYIKMLDILQPFVDDTAGFQWLYDLDYEMTKIEFLFSAGGGW